MTTVHMILGCVGTTSYTTAPSLPMKFLGVTEKKILQTWFVHEIHYLSVIMFKVSHGGLFNFQKCHIFIKLYMSILFIKFFFSSLAQTIWERSSLPNVSSFQFHDHNKEESNSCMYLFILWHNQFCYSSYTLPF